MKFHIPLEENFRAQWRWISKTGGNKYQWPGLNTIKKQVGEIPINACFCCEAVRVGDGVQCQRCPVDFGGIGHNAQCVTIQSIYRQYSGRTGEEAKRLAAQIAELPWRK